MVGDGDGRGAMICAGSRAGPHGLGNDLQPLRGGLAVLLLVLRLGVVLQEELTGLLQHSSAFADGAVETRETVSQHTSSVTDRPSALNPLC